MSVPVVCEGSVFAHVILILDRFLSVFACRQLLNPQNYLYNNKNRSHHVV
ncbi:hypothetical protein NBRC111894_2200 [Sporolactobacillus inulinus]|uniref:Uncharacterized protein n=1 Tax=Sporolactobacillus inulinus TaxID=2078 RepID=A0A4Y1ZC20_9BACL|nr:hypothetical protein NBRC111894_2200 [Sporolactobacillus inulinus]